MTRLQKSRWMRKMKKRYGSEEAVRAEMKRRQQKSMENPNRQKGVHRGGFSNVELASEAGKKGASVRWGTGNTESNKE